MGGRRGALCRLRRIETNGTAGGQLGLKGLELLEGFGGVRPLQGRSLIREWVGRRFGDQVPLQSPELGRCRFGSGGGQRVGKRQARLRETVLKGIERRVHDGLSPLAQLPDRGSQGALRLRFPVLPALLRAQLWRC